MGRTGSSYAFWGHLSLSGLRKEVGTGTKLNSQKQAWERKNSPDYLATQLNLATATSGKQNIQKSGKIHFRKKAVGVQHNFCTHSRHSTSGKLEIRGDIQEVNGPHS